MEHLDCVVIGAGVVGLAVARELALKGREVMVVESENDFGTQTSARNSEVIHAGISYPQDTYKARFCVLGRKMLYEYCDERDIGYQRIGKLIVAANDGDMEGLEVALTLGKNAGVQDLRLLSQAELMNLEPNVIGVAAVFSPSTGIVDSHGLMLSLLGDALRAGALLAVNSPVMGGQATTDGIVLQIGGKTPSEYLCRTVINSAGLNAHTVAANIKGIPVACIPDIHFALGRYYVLTGKSPFQHLVYPVSRKPSERVHVTIDLAGQCRFGPDLEWVDRVDYKFDDRPEVRAGFYAGIRRYFPDLQDGALQPGYTGIRPRLAGPNEALHAGAADWLFQDVHTHGISGLINLFGMESPALTASLAIGKHVASLAMTDS